MKASMKLGWKDSCDLKLHDEVPHVHVHRDPKLGGALLIVRDEGQRGDGVDENSAEASVQRAVQVAMLFLHLQTHDNTTKVTLNELALERTTKEI